MSIESQGSNNKRIAINTLLLYGRMLFLMAISLYTSRINLQSLGVDDFGIYNVVGGVVATFSIISGALSVAISRNITIELGRGDLQKLNKVFSMSINIQLLIGLVVILFAETIGLWFLNTRMVIPAERIMAANWVFQFSLVSFLIDLLSVPYNASIIAHEKMSAFAYISIIEAALKLAIAYSLYVSPIDKLVTFGFLLMCVSLLVRLIYGIYCKRKFEECTYHFTKDKELFKSMTTFAGWTMFGNMAVVGYTYGLNIILNLFFGPSVNAARGIAVQVQQAIQRFCTNFQMALNPQIMKNYASGNMERMHSLVFASSKYSFFLLFFLSLPVLIESKEILQLWLGVVPEHTVNFMRLILIIIGVEAIANPLTIGAQANGNIKLYQIVVGGMMIAILPISYIILKLGASPESVFVVHLSIIILAQAVRLLFMRKMINLSLRQYAKDVIAPICSVSVVSVIAPILVSKYMQEGILRLFTVCVVSVVSIIITTYILGLRRNERQVINKKISKIIYKIK